MSMRQLSRTLILGLAVAVTGAFASPMDFFEDLNRGSGWRDPAGRYYDDGYHAQDEYQESAYKAQERYDDAIRRAEEKFHEERRYADNDREYNRALDRFQERVRKAKKSYNDDLDRIGRSYERDKERSRERYWENRDRYEREIYDDYWGNRNRDWDRYRRREHEREWYSRRRNHYPDYDWDHGDYWYDREIYGRYDHSSPYDRGSITYWRDGRGDWGYYREHEDERLRRTGWNLSVDFSVPGNHGYVARDPYTYGRGSRYSHRYYQDYRWRENRLRYRNEPSFRLAGGNDYWGDSYLFGELYFPLN